MEGGGFNRSTECAMGRSLAGAFTKTLPDRLKLRSGQ